MTPREDQEASIGHLLKCLKADRYAVDGSDCGIGKTLVATETAKRTNTPLTVVCPKAAMPGWFRHGESQDAEMNILNWEMVRTGRSSLGKWLPSGDPRKLDEFEWNKDKVKFLAFDEIHRAMSYRSKNGAMVRAAKRQNIPAMGLSATLADTPLELDSVGYMLGLHDGQNPKATLRKPCPVSFFDWVSARSCEFDSFNGGWTFNGTDAHRQAVMKQIHHDIYPRHGVRVRTKDLGDKFPETQIFAELYSLGDTERVNALYERMKGPLEILAQAKETDVPGHVLTGLLRDRQEVELLKAPVMADLARDYERQGYSVAMFVNFRATLEWICEDLDSNCFIDGSQIGPGGAAQRELNRQDFQSDQEHFITAIGGAGGIGIDLHDIHGIRPRVSLISPGFNAKELIQILGRIHRAGGLSKSLQRIICAAGTVEVGVFKAFNSKVNCLDTLNDGDLIPRFK